MARKYCSWGFVACAALGALGACSPRAAEPGEAGAGADEGASTVGAAGTARMAADRLAGGLGIEDPVARAAFIARRQADADDSYRVEPVDATAGSYRTVNRAARLSAKFDGARVALAPASARQPDAATPELAPGAVGLRLTRVGYADGLRPVAEAAPARVDGNRLELDRGALVEWYLNGPLGLEQGFTLRAPPATGNGELVVEVAVEGATPVATATGDAVTLDRGPGRARMRYGELTVLDADGRAVPARLAVAGGAIQLRLADRDARYPLVIDPLVVLSETILMPRVYEHEGMAVGTDVAVDGDLAVLAAVGYQVNAVDAGAVYVLARYGQRWVQEAVLVGNGDRFASGVDIHGSTVAVGATFADASDGAVYVYEKVGGSWVEQARLSPPDLGQTLPRMGGTVELGDGELLASGTDGAAYLFSGSGTSWSYTAEFPGTTTLSQAAALDGNVLVSGRNVYERDAMGWRLAQTLPDLVGEPRRVGVQGETVALVYPDEVHVYVKQGSQWVPEDVLFPSVGTGNLGPSFRDVSIQGDRIAVGSSGADLPIWDSGAVFVYGRLDGQWSAIDVLTSPEPQMSAGLGSRVSLSGSTLLISCAGFDAPNGLLDVGAAYVTEAQGSGFGELVRVTPALYDGSPLDPEPGVGESVAIDGDTIVLGADRSGIQAFRNGGGYVFVRHPGSVWEQEGWLLVDDPVLRRFLGKSADVHADTAILGAPDDEANPTGSAYVFFRSAGVWSQQGKLLPPDGASGDDFGLDVAVHGDTAVVGAPRHDSTDGAAYVFTRSGTTWSFQQKLTASDTLPDMKLGTSVDIEGDTLLVGAPERDHLSPPPGNWPGIEGGAAYVFTRSGTTWTEQVRLEGWNVDRRVKLGSDVAIDGNTIAITGDGTSLGATVDPAIFLYEGSGASWTPLARILPPTAESVGMDGDVVVADEHVYAPTTAARTTWQLQTDLVPSPIAAAHNYPGKVAVAGTTVVVGPWINNNDPLGAAFVFELADALALGTGCTADAQCVSNLCVEGVCCNEACNGPCESCSQFLKADGSADGTCGMVTPGVPCGDPAGCVSSVRRALAPTCDAAGVCQPRSFECEGGYACIGDSVTGRCAHTCNINAADDHAYCADDHYCDAGSCPPDQGVGADCPFDEACLGGSCVAGKCLGTIGDPCTTVACAQGTCVDGYCCEEVCNQTCEACGEPGNEGRCVGVTGAPRGNRTPCVDHAQCGGACTPLRRDACTYPGSETPCGQDACVDGDLTLNQCNGQGACVPDAPVSCAPYRNCADASSCDTACSSDGQCVDNHFCDGSSCVPDLGGGATCDRDEQCSTGFCADGVCCNTACNQQCEACAELGQVGTCTAVTGPPRSPRLACAGTGTACEGSCDGAVRSACTYPVATSCGSSTCANGVAFGALCNGQGGCATSSAGTSCFPYTACADGTQCLASCSGPSQCAASYFCDAARVPAQCVQQQADGETCDTAAQCLSGFCVDGVCCNTECTGQCQACAETGSEGQCVVVSGEPRGGRAACAGTADANNVCAGTCDGAEGDACSYPAQGTACEDAACDGAVLTPARVCDGAGVCGLPGTQDCGAYGCDATQGRCNTRCESRGDCAAGALCRLESRECAFVPSVCVDAFTVELADGSQSSCGGHRCSAGACQETCALDDDCAPGYLCFDRDCVPEADVARDAGVDAGMSGAVDAGSSTTGSDASSPDAGGASTSDAATPPEPAPVEAPEDSGCGCRAPGSHAPSGRGLLTALLPLLVACLRTRRRRGRG